MVENLSDANSGGASDSWMMQMFGSSSDQHSQFALQPQQQQPQFATQQFPHQQLASEFNDDGSGGGGGGVRGGLLDSHANEDFSFFRHPPHQFGTQPQPRPFAPHTSTSLFGNFAERDGGGGGIEQQQIASSFPSSPPRNLFVGGVGGSGGIEEEPHDAIGSGGSFLRRLEVAGGACNNRIPNLSNEGALDLEPQNAASLRRGVRREAGDGGGTDDASRHSWYYVDPQQIIQGPFSDSQMEAWWCMRLYFKPEMRIRRECDAAFITLGKFIDLCGGVPFQTNNALREVPPISLDQVAQLESKPPPPTVPAPPQNSTQNLTLAQQQLEQQNASVSSSTMLPDFSESGMSSSSVTATASAITASSSGSNSMNYATAASLNPSHHMKMENSLIDASPSMIGRDDSSGDASNQNATPNTLNTQSSNQQVQPPIKFASSWHNRRQLSESSPPAAPSISESSNSVSPITTSVTALQQEPPITEHAAPLPSPQTSSDQEAGSNTHKHVHTASPSNRTHQLPITVEKLSDIQRNQEIAMKRAAAAEEQMLRAEMEQREDETASRRDAKQRNTTYRHIVMSGGAATSPASGATAALTQAQQQPATATANQEVSPPQQQQQLGFFTRFNQSSASISLSLSPSVTSSVSAAGSAVASGGVAIKNVNSHGHAHPHLISSPPNHAPPSQPQQPHQQIERHSNWAQMIKNTTAGSNSSSRSGVQHHQQQKSNFSPSSASSAALSSSTAFSRAIHPTASASANYFSVSSVPFPSANVSLPFGSSVLLGASSAPPAAPPAMTSSSELESPNVASSSATALSNSSKSAKFTGSSSSSSNGVEALVSWAENYVAKRLSFLICAKSGSNSTAATGGGAVRQQLDMQTLVELCISVESPYEVSAIIKENLMSSSSLESASTSISNSSSGGAIKSAAATTTGSTESDAISDERQSVVLDHFIKEFLDRRRDLLCKMRQKKSTGCVAAVPVAMTSCVPTPSTSCSLAATMATLPDTATATISLSNASNTQQHHGKIASSALFSSAALSANSSNSMRLQQQLHQQQKSSGGVLEGGTSLHQWGAVSAPGGTAHSTVSSVGAAHSNGLGPLAELSLLNLHDSAVLPTSTNLVSASAAALTASQKHSAAPIESTAQRTGKTAPANKNSAASDVANGWQHVGSKHNVRQQKPRKKQR